MGVLLAFMFFLNMVGALFLLPALAAFFLGRHAARRRERAEGNASRVARDQHWRWRWVSSLAPSRSTRPMAPRIPDATHLLAAVTYHLVHGLALVIEGALWRASPSRWLLAAYVLHAAGLVLFCAGLWILAMDGTSLGPVIPAGGFAFIAGWIALAVHALRMPRT